MRDRFWLEEIIDQCDMAGRFAAGKDDKSLYAMLKATENVWEAVKALSDESLHRLFPDPDELGALRRTRDFYAHQYHRIDPTMARATAKQDLARIAGRARSFLEEGPPVG